MIEPHTPLDGNADFSIAFEDLARAAPKLSLHLYHVKNEDEDQMDRGKECG